ncbi:uncharacterized protein [Palaemon carinicauda]|uniref:uncharacterized protein isoform X2 n=1 Tax=Palaemon carinicauda TaxID=392227 RepID=UPI0035B64B76
MSPLSRGDALSFRNLVTLTNRFLLHLLVGGVILLQFETLHSIASSIPIDGVSKLNRTSANSLNYAQDIEEFVKALEYEASNGDDKLLDGSTKITFNLLDDDAIGYQIQDGLEEEFAVVDEALGETSNSTATEKPGPTSRQLSLIYQGVYAPDSRFNAFADGVMVNMVAEMKRKRMDPLYFRVYDRGIVEHVTATPGRRGKEDNSTSVSSLDGKNSTSRRGRQSGNAIGGGVIRGLTNTKRFGNAEVQIAGNTTLVRTHYVLGPLNIELVYNTDKGVKTINSTLGALATHAVAGLKDNSSKLIDFIIDSPLFDYMPYYGNRTLAQQKTTEQVVRHLFSNGSFMTLLMKDSFEIASYDKIIPQFGTESNYYSVLKYLFDGTQNGNGRTSHPPAARGISLPGFPAVIGAYLADISKSKVN